MRAVAARQPVQPRDADARCAAMIDMSTDKGRAMMDAMVNMQAQIIAFSHDYQMVRSSRVARYPAGRFHDRLRPRPRCASRCWTPEHAVIE